VILRPSPIDGWGVFADRDYEEGEEIYVMLEPCDEDEGAFARTEACRMTNHSSRPTVFISDLGDRASAVASRDIRAGEELTADYEKGSGVIYRFPMVRKIIRETDGVEHIITDDSDTTLQQQLMDIMDGKYK
jgi:hypothetical protein